MSNYSGHFPRLKGHFPTLLATSDHRHVDKLTSRRYPQAFLKAVGDIVGTQFVHEQSNGGPKFPAHGRKLRYL